MKCIVDTLSAGRCSGFICASHAADWGSIPCCGKSASHQTASSKASAGIAHSLTRKINPPTASLVPRSWYGVAQGYRKGDEHLRLSRPREQPKFAFFFCTQRQFHGLLTDFITSNYYAHKHLLHEVKLCCILGMSKSKYQTVEVLYDQALNYKLSGNQLFKCKEFNKAKKNYHCALLQTRAISSRDTVGRSMSFFNDSVNDGLKYNASVDFKNKVEALEADCNKNLAMIFITEENWSKGLEYSKKALDVNDSDEKSLYRYLTCATNLGLIDEANIVVNKLLSINPNSSLYRQAFKSLQIKTKKQTQKQKELYKNMFKS